MSRVAIVVAWNGKQTPNLISSLKSLDAQTHSAHQKILVTDGFIIDKALSRIFPDWDVIPNLTNVRGPAVSRNLAFEYLRKDIDFVLISDADDVSHPKRIESLLDLIVDKGFDLVGSRAVIITRSVILSRKLIVPYPKMPTSETVIRKRLLKNRPGFVNPTIMFRKSILDLVGNYNTDFLRGEDLDFIRRAVSFEIKIANSEQYLYGYRQNLFTRYNYLRNDLKYTGRANLALIIYIVHFVKRLYALAFNRINPSDKAIFAKIS